MSDWSDAVADALLRRMEAVRLRVVAEPTVEDITIEEVHQHLEIPLDDTHDDAWFSSHLPAAREWCEFYSGLCIGQRTLELALDAFPSGPIVLPMGPVSAIDSIIYFDEDEVSTTLDESAYFLDSYAEPTLLFPAADTLWPATQVVRNAVKIRYFTGFSLSTDSPSDLPMPWSHRAAILLVLGHLHENKENSIVGDSIEEIPLGAAALLEKTRIRLGMA